MTRSAEDELLGGRSAFLFDLDGTLVDSSALHEAAYRAVLEREAPELLRAFDYHRVKGMDTRGALGSLGLERDGLLDALAAKKQCAYRERVARGELRAMPAARELLWLLRERGKRLALVTSASRGSADAALAACGLAAFFDQASIVTGSDVPIAKPDPAIYRLAVRRLGADPRTVVAVEDAVSGVDSAIAAGIDVVVVHGPTSRPSVRSFSDLRALLSALLGSPR